MTPLGWRPYQRKARQLVYLNDFEIEYVVRHRSRTATQWWRYGECGTCTAPAQEPCRDLRRTHAPMPIDKAMPHHGRAQTGRRSPWWKGST